MRGMAASPITIEDVERAARAIADSVARTPSATSLTLSEILGATVILKFEIFQFTAAFKERGARNRLLALSKEEREGGVVAVSAGNHAQAVAHHARLLGIPATIVMPRGTPFVKIARTRHLGATVELAGETIEEAMTHGLELVDKGLVFIHPFDDPLVIAGQGTVALELLEDHPEIDTIVVPVGGGGLISGIATVAAAKRPDLKVVGVQAERYPGMVNALKGGGSIPGGITMAEGIAVAKPGTLTTPIVRDHVAEVLTVSEQSLVDAVNLLMDIEKVVVEGAGAAGIAAMVEHPKTFAGRTVGVVLSGGNIDQRMLASIIDRGLVRSGRLSRLNIVLDDRPGALATLLSIVGESGANILEVRHDRLFGDVPVRSVDVELWLETADKDHLAAVFKAIRGAGYPCAELPITTIE
jgi:threonine dehydratase